MRVLICGGGVIGASIAYFLSRRGVEATVIEGTGLACAASGKSGGFLALDWCDGTPLEPLARRSFALHAQLAQELGSDWGYRRLTTYGGFAGNRHHARHRGNSRDIDWLSAGVRVDQRLGSTDTTAQIHPRAFVGAIMQAAQAQGAELRLGRVTGILRQGNTGKVMGVEVDGETVEGDAVVIAMGPWSILAAKWLPLPAVFGLKGHSLVFDTGTRLSADALFIEYREASGAIQSPELFPRTDGTTYICAISSDSPLPVDPAEVAPDPGAIERLHAICSDAVAGARLLANPGAAGVLSSDHPGWPAADRPGARRRGRLHRHWAQRLGHAERAGDRRGHGRAADRRCDAGGRPVAVRPRPIAPADAARPRLADFGKMLMQRINILNIHRLGGADRAQIEAVDAAVALTDAGGWFDGEIRQTWPAYTAARYLPTGTTGSGTREERDRLLACAEIILGGFPFPLDLRARAPRLKWFHQRPAGASNLLRGDLWGSGVMVTTSRGVGSTLAMAEYAVAGILHFAKGLHRARHRS